MVENIFIGGFVINVKAVLVRSTFMWTKASTQSIIATRFKSYDFVVQFEWIMLIHLIFDRFVIMAVTWLLNQLVEQKSIKFVFMSVTCLLPVVWIFWKISSEIEFLSPFVSTFQLFQVKRKIYLNSNNTSQRYCCTIFSLRKSFSSLSLKIFTC